MPITVSTETNLASRQCDNVVRETIKVLCEPITTSREAKQALREPIKISIKTNLTSRQCDNVAREAIKVPYEPKTATSKATWVARFTVSSLDSA